MTRRIVNMSSQAVSFPFLKWRSRDSFILVANSTALQGRPPMLFQELIDRFAQGTPLTVMTRAVLEHTLDPEPLNQLFEKEAQTQYTRDLLFSQVIAVMGLVVCGFYSSPHAVYRKRKDLFPVTRKCFYEKLNGIELPLMQAVLRDNV